MAHLSNTSFARDQDAGYIDGMELRHLRHFVAVAETLHFGRAAERLVMAQPPLSQSIRLLEAEVGVALLVRTSRSVALTAAGEVFYAEATRILSSVDAAGMAARRAAAGSAGWLGVGFSASASFDVLPEVLREFRARFADVELRLFELNAAEQAAALRDGKIHVGLARPSVEGAGLASETVAREPFAAALPAAHPRALDASVDLADLRDEPFVVFPTFPKPSYGDTVLQACAAAGFVPRAAQEAREMQTAIALVSAGIGVTLVPLSVQRMVRAGVSYVPLRAPELWTELTAVSRAGDASPTLANFLALLRGVR